MRSEPHGSKGISRLVTDEVTGRAAVLGYTQLRGVSPYVAIARPGPESLRERLLIAVPLEEAEELIAELMGVVARARADLREKGELP